MDLGQLIADLARRRTSVWDLHRAGKDLRFPPDLIAEELSKAHAARDAHMVEALLNLASLHPAPEYTAVTCTILEDSEPLWGAQEAALDLLEASMDPASFDCLVRVASRSNLAFDPTDWRKALVAIAGFSRQNLLRTEVVEEALKKISRSGNAIAELAAEQLADLQKQEGAPRGA